MASPKLLKRAVDPTEVTRIEKALSQSISRQQRIGEESDVITQELRKFIDSEQGQLAGEVGDRVARERASEPKFDGTGPRPHQQQQRQRQETFIGLSGMRSRAVNNPEEATNISRATDMNVDGHSAREIWEETGVIYGPDGHRRMEIPDYDMDYNKPLMDHILVNGPGSLVRLEALVKHDGLREVYPEIFSTRVRVITRPEKFIARVQFQTAEGKPVIEVNQNYFKELNAYEQSAVVMHEVQHIIQNLEGLPAGTNPNFEALRYLQNNIPENLLGHIPGGPDPAGSLLSTTRSILNDLVRGAAERELTPAERQDMMKYVQIEKLAARAIQEGRSAYFRNIGEVEAFDVENRLEAMGLLDDFPPALIQALEEDHLDKLYQRQNEGPGISEARGRRPGGRTTDPRRLPSLLPNGIHYDNNGFPFKVKDRRIVRMSDEETEEALTNAPLTGEEIDESVLIQRARQESQERARKARQTKLDNEKKARQQKEMEDFKNSEEFRRLQEQSLSRVQRAREQRFRESEEFQELQRQNLNRSRTALGQKPEEAPTPQSEPTTASTQNTSKPEDSFEKKKKDAIARGKDKREGNVEESKESLLAGQQGQFDEARLAAENEVFAAQRDSIFEPATMAQMDDVALFEDMQGFLDETNALVADGKLPEDRAQSLLNLYLERVDAAGKSDQIEDMLSKQETTPQQQQAQAQGRPLFRGLKPNGRPRGYPGEFYTELEGLAGRYAGADGSMITREELPEQPFNVDAVADMPQEERMQMLSEFTEFMKARHPGVPEEELIGPGQSDFAYLDRVLGEPFETDFIYPTQDDVDFLRSKGYDSVFFGQEGGEEVNSWFIFDQPEARQPTPQQQPQAQAFRPGMATQRNEFGDTAAAFSTVNMTEDGGSRFLKQITKDQLERNVSVSLKNPIRLKDGGRLSGFTDPITQTTMYGYNKNGELFTWRRGSIDPEELVSSRDNNKTRDALKEFLETQRNKGNL